MVLSRHEHAIVQCQDLAERNRRKLLQLEDLVDRSPTPSVPAAKPSVDGSEDATRQPPAQPVRQAAPQQLDINRFSEQQKRLLAVFFENRDRQMSYADVAVRLGRSPCTIKNQIHKIRRKADLFECFSGPQNRNYFRLKDDLRVERLLKIGRSWDQPGTMAWPDPAEPEAVPARDSFSYPKAPTQQ